MDNQVEIQSAELWVSKRQDTILNKLTSTHTLHYNLEIEFKNTSSKPFATCVMEFKARGPSTTERRFGLWPAGQSSATFAIPGRTRFGMLLATNALDQKDYRLVAASVRLVCLDPNPGIGGWQSVDLSRTVWDENSIGEFDTRAPR